MTDLERQRRVTLPVLQAPAPDSLRLSRNDKTGVSLNVAIVGSCRPTPACASYCYGFRGPIGMDSAVTMYAGNLARLRALEHASTEVVIAEADGIAAECRRAGRTWLRVNGVGDLTAGSVRLLTALALRHPWLTLWIATRKPDLARRLPDAPHVQIMLSTDRTTTARAWLESRWIVECRPATAFLAYTRLDATDRAPSDVAVVFERHAGAFRAAWPADDRACGATVRGGDAHANACDACRRCFDTERRAACE